MPNLYVVGLAALTFIYSLDAALAATKSSLVTIKTPRGTHQSFILIEPERPIAAAILFAGGHGALGLKSSTQMNWGAGNFLVRTRHRFANHGLMVAVVDAPSDRPKRMNAIFRMSRAHAGDIDAVAKHLRKLANVPVWLVGTSMGTFSAANAAIRLRGVDGLVLTSSVTRARRNWKIVASHPNGIASMPLGRITQPTLIVSHRDDGCAITPASDATKLQKRLGKARPVKVVILSSGAKPRSGPCKARSQHGFLGIEGKTVATIADFINKHPKPGTKN